MDADPGQQHGHPDGCHATDHRAAGVAAAAGRAGDGRQVAQLEVATPEGSVFLVREGERAIAATTRPEPAAGLVFYDLKACLRGIADQAKPRPKARKQADATA